MADFEREIDVPNLWQIIQAEAGRDIAANPLLTSYLTRHLLATNTMAEALAEVLAQQLTPAAERDQAAVWRQAFVDLYEQQPQLVAAAQADLLCQLKANAAIKDHYTPLLYFGGYQALQCYRLAHAYWQLDQQPMAAFIQASMVTCFGVDIHPAACIGQGIFMDHAVGIVIGETAVVEDEVVIFQSVTLGGTGTESGDRHPKIRRGAFIGCGAQILGNIEIGAGAKVGAGAVVVKPVAPGATVLGPSAKLFAKT
jgi:serine O-acetyltransferase